MSQDNKNTNNNNKIKQRKTTIFDEYMDYHYTYTRKINANVVILMQVGMFYETYSTDTLGPDLNKLSKILNIAKGKKSNEIEIVNESNPYLLGFPVAVMDKYVKILMDNNYNVVIIDQIKNNNKIDREVTNVFSPATYINTCDIESNGLMVIYVEYNKSLTSNKKICSVGMSLIDISIGTVIYYETHATNMLKDETIFDETNKFYQNYRPAELIVYEIDITGNEANNFMSHIDLLPNQVLFYYEKINPNFCKLNYQNEIFQKVYSTNTIVSPIEQFNIAKFQMSIISLVIGFNYIHQHNNVLTNKIKEPIIYDKHTNMILYNNAQYQLNIIEYNTHESVNCKFRSLYDVLNNCCTAMGKRFLKEKLCAPFTDKNKINYFYDLSDKIIKNNFNDKIIENLNTIGDLEKIFRKIVVNRILIPEMYTIYNSLIGIANTIKLFMSNNMKSDIYDMLGKKNIKMLNDCILNIENKFEIDKLKSGTNIYKKGIYQNLDTLQSKISSNKDVFDSFAKILNECVGETNLKIKTNDIDGIYLTTSLIKGKKLEQELLKNNNPIIINDDITITKNDICIKYNKNNVKITCDLLKKYSTSTSDCESEYLALLKEYFLNDITTWYMTYENTLSKIIYAITTIDYVSNNVYTSTKYHYTKPILDLDKLSVTNDELLVIDKSLINGKSLVNNESSSINNNNNSSFINAVGARHPIIERLLNYEYVPHNITLDNNTVGSLIYGLNGCGKSSLMKTIATLLIMAQCGLYVPCESFKFNVFESLFTRITANDNLFKGESTYIVEMKELKCILKNANEKSLVIGDEVCKGTESISGNSIVASSIMRFSRKNIKFLFATHLHELSNFEQIQNLKNIKFCHIDVEETDNQLIFSRKLIDGVGPLIYGITVAKYILNDPEFINDAISFKNELFEKNGISSMLVNDKQSIYNKNIYVDKCYICDSNYKLETHHINFQSNFIQKLDGLINKEKLHVLINDQCNLIVLCAKCHDKLHSGEINIKKKVKTSKGMTVV